MRWYEYKMEADDLAAPDDLKAKLLAMTSQLTEEEKNHWKSVKLLECPLP